MGKLELEKKYEDQVLKCSRCGFCRTICPTFEAKDFLESYGARGRMILLKAVDEGKIQLNQIQSDQSLVDRIFTCTLCGACMETCPSKVDYIATMEAARAGLVKLGLAPPDFDEFGKMTLEKGNVLGQDNARRMKWASKLDNIKVNEPAETLYFVGCNVMRPRVRPMATAAGKVLQAANVDFAVMGEDEWCCGLVFINTGHLDVAKEFAKHNIELIEKINPKRIVTICPGCAQAIQHYEHLVGWNPGDIQIIHAVEYIAELLDQGKFTFTKEFNGGSKVAYHDPCELGRQMGVFDAPRKILNAIPGLEWVELENNKELSHCCGGGSGLQGIDTELAREVANYRLKEVQDAGADVLVTACPTCRSNFLDTIKQNNLAIKVMDIHEILAQALE
ncbi:(Fe-S)-binding protein [Candidatus Borrarchaeum sp.]|uniref:(Fe-S)-binding protein n=1 Tax=Candidatus Borrarchaeum sp. TaxID=2846742 RepID=UPI00257D4A5A|nr:(Fe-S)-binding protein [Candidatus Borrarchaeum sp.]